MRYTLTFMIKGRQTSIPFANMLQAIETMDKLEGNGFHIAESLEGKYSHVYKLERI